MESFKTEIEEESDSCDNFDEKLNSLRLEILQKQEVVRQEIIQDQEDQPDFSQ